MRYQRLALWGVVLAALPMWTLAPGCGMLISRDQEIAMGVEAAPEFEKEFDGPVANAQLQAYVAGIGAKMAAVCDRDMPYEYILLKSDNPNAFALPGGKIYITAGLMRRMTNERQLAAVLGHETGHVAKKHNVKGLERQMGVLIFAEVLGALAGEKGAAAEAGAKIAGSMVNMKYGRGDEYEADEMGLEYMTKAGYNPWGVVELLQVLVDMQTEAGGGGGTIAEMLSTHPDSEKRVGRTTGLIEGDDDLSKHKASTADPNAGKFLSMRALLPPAKK